MKSIVEWIFTPAEWYEFWMPQSGLAGGALASAIVLVLAEIAGMLA